MEKEIKKLQKNIYREKVFFYIEKNLVSKNKLKPIESMNLRFFIKKGGRNSFDVSVSDKEVILKQNVRFEDFNYELNSLTKKVLQNKYKTVKKRQTNKIRLKRRQRRKTLNRVFVDDSIMNADNEVVCQGV